MTFASHYQTSGGEKKCCGLKQVVVVTKKSGVGVTAATVVW